MCTALIAIAREMPAASPRYRPTPPNVGAIDLQPTSIDAGAVTTDPQTLALSGTVHVTVRNNGPDPYQSNVAGLFDALALEDRNVNGT